jgi:hypothetical protein
LDENVVFDHAQDNFLLSLQLPYLVGRGKYSVQLLQVVRVEGLRLLQVVGLATQVMHIRKLPNKSGKK